MEFTDRCPWCGTVIPRTKFLEIEAKIREQERKKMEEIEKRMKEAAKQQIASIAAERDRTAQKVKLLEGREAEVRKKAQEDAEARVIKALEESGRQHQKELAKQRQILDEHRDQEVLKAQAAFNREREGYQKKIKEMERQLQRKTAHEMGEGAEIDLFEALRAAFPGDRITRIQKGQPGADILQEVLHNGGACGSIIIDSKNRQAWQNTFASKLREDQVTAKAEHAILSTTVFPSGKKEFCLEGGVIVTSPARVVPIIELLRGVMVRMHVLGLSMKERAGKIGRLYKFITSEAYVRRFDEAGRLTNEVLELDVLEEKEHQKVWKKRGLLATRLKNVLREIDTEIAAILEGPNEESAEAA